MYLAYLSMYLSWRILNSPRKVSEYDTHTHYLLCSLCYPPIVYHFTGLQRASASFMLITTIASLHQWMLRYLDSKMVLYSLLRTGTNSHLILKMWIIYWRAACSHKLTVVVKFITASQSGFCQLKGIFSDKHPGRGSEQSLHLSINPYKFSNIHPFELEAE